MSALPKPGDIVAGKYRIERSIGMGGMGAVFEATHRVTGKRFAVKWLLPDVGAREDAARRFIREAQVAGRFEHPNVVEVYDVGEERGSFYMVMELLYGESLAARLERAKSLTFEEIYRILLPCMRGVARAHEAGIVHRDLKPANIFLCRATADTPERPKVLDFGISKMSNLAGEVSSSITKTGMVMGTPHYMSPEQLRGTGVDHRADVYALGVILYQLLSGELPFPADSFSALVLQIATEMPTPLDKLVSGLPVGLVQLVNRAMARKPEDRFATLDAMVQAFEPFGTGRAAANSPALRESPSAQSSGRSTLALDTPLSSESNASLPIREAGTSRLWWMVGAAAATMLVLGVMLAKLLTSGGDGAAASGSKASPNTHAANAPSPPSPQHAVDASTAGQPALGDAPGAADEPHPKTIRVRDEPKQKEDTGKPQPSHPPLGPPRAEVKTIAHTDDKPANRRPAHRTRETDKAHRDTKAPEETESNTATSLGF